MMLFRRLNLMARTRGVAVCAVCALTLNAGAADAAHARSRRAAQSAGVAEAHGKLADAETSSGRRSRRHAVNDPKSQKKSSPGTKDRKGPAAKHNAPSHSERAGTSSKRRRRQREIEVDQPVPMSQAALRREKKRNAREDVAAKTPDREAKSRTAPAAAAAADAATADAAPKPVTVDDFIRAANGGVLPGEANPAQGVSKPDVSERIETADAPAAPAVAAPAKARAAAKPVQHASVVAATDAAPPTQLPAEHVVDGFGAEVAVVPGTSSPRAGLSRKNAPPDELAANDKTLQRELADDAMKPVVVPLYTRSGKLLTPAPMKGSHEVLVHQNLMADQEGLARIQDDDDLNKMRAAHLLLPLPDLDALEINAELPYNRRYARPWTVKFVADIARAYYAKFHDPLRLNSAVRTVEFQRRLQRTNGNAAAIEGDTASPHLTGQAIDFGKGGMTRVEIAWMRAYLGPIMAEGKIDVEEEFQQACFHISVYTSYAPKKPLRQDVAEVRTTAR